MDIDDSNRGPVECLGLTFEVAAARREHFTKLLREMLENPNFRQIRGFSTGFGRGHPRNVRPSVLHRVPKLMAHPVRCGARSPVRRRRGLPPRAVRCRRLEGKTDQLYRAHSYHTKVPHLAIIPSILDYTDPGEVVLDSFAGTGMTGVAARFGVSGDLELRRAIDDQIRSQGMAEPEWGLARPW